MAQHTVTLKGASGIRYVFDVYPANSNWGDNIACVYYVSKCDDKGFHTPIYVGETGDLKTRHGDHHKQKCFENNGYNCISIHRQANEKTRLQIEEDLVKVLDLPCNH